MLAPLVALQLLVHAQAVPALEDPAGPTEELKLQQDQGAPTPGDEAQPESNPPLPNRPGHEAPPPPPAPPAAEATPPAQQPAPPSAAPSSAKAAAGAGQLSLLSSEPLHGGSAALAWAGWSSFGAAYAQGVTPQDDLGAFGEFDWAKTELRLGAFYRRPLGPAGPFAMAGRLALAYYADFGADYIYSDNHHDRGLELTPGLSLSAPGAGGVFSILGEAPITVTWTHDGGVLFSPRISFAYETPLYGPYTVGVLAGIGYRVGAGDAPLADGQTELRFLVVGGYRVF